MAVSPQPCFTIDASKNAAFDTVSSNTALPGTLASDTVIRLINTSGSNVFIVLGSSSVVATVAAGVCIAPGPVPTYLGINGATYIAGITSGASQGAGWVPTGVLNIATGN